MYEECNIVYCWWVLIVDVLYVIKYYVVKGRIELNYKIDLVLVFFVMINFVY